MNIYYEISVCIGKLDELDKVKLTLRTYPQKHGPNRPDVQVDAQLRIKTWFRNKVDNTVYTV